MSEIGQGESEVQAPPPTEQTRSQEGIYTRAKVIAAFDHGFSLLQNEIDNTTRARVELSPELLWIQKAVGDAKNKTDLENGVDTFENSFTNHHTGKEFVQREGIPVDQLLNFMIQKAQALPQGEERDQLSQDITTLLVNSKAYHEFPDRMAPPQLVDRVEAENSQLAGRIHQESYLVSQDVRARSDMEKNWFLAKRALTDRLELVLPPEQTQGQETKPEEETQQNDKEDQDDEDDYYDDYDEDESSPPPPDHYDVMIGSQNEDIRKLVAREAEMKMEERLTEGFPTHLPQNRVLKLGRLVAHSLNPKNWGRMWFNNAKEYYRQIWMSEHYQNLRDINFGATNNLTTEAAAKVNAQIRQARAEGKKVVERIKLGPEGVRSEEIGPTEVTGDLRQYVLDDILKPAVASLKPIIDASTTPDEDQINQIENQIQQKIFEYVKAHQNDKQITDFFGRSATKYGELSEFYASDIIETARRIVSDQRADAFAKGEIDQIIKINIFKAKWAEGTEKFSDADKLLAWAEKNRVAGRLLINPATAGIIASTATFLSMRALGAGVRATHIATPLVGAAVGAMVAGFRRNKDLKEQYQATARQLEAGNESVPEAGSQREALEELIKPLMATQDNLVNGGGNDTFGEQRQSIDQMLDQGAWDALAKRYAEIQARLNFPVHPRKVHRFLFFGTKTVPEDIGIISYGDSMEGGRLELAKKMVEIKLALTDQERGGLSEEEFNERINGSIDPNNENTGLVNRVNERLIKNREIQEAAFNKYKLGQVLQSALVGGVTGLTMGLVSQEILALAARGLPQAADVPVLGSMFKTGTTQIERPINWLSDKFGFGTHIGETVGAPSEGPVNMEDLKHLYHEGGTVDLGDHFKAQINPDHSVSISDATTNQPVPGLGKMTVGENGHIDVVGDIPTQMQTELQSKGFNINKLPDILETVQTTAKKPVVGPEGEFTKHGTLVDHRDRYLNNTPGSDVNELREHTLKSGKAITIDMSAMQKGFQTGLNPSELNVADEVIKAGKAGVYITLGDDPQNGVWVPDSADGVIDGKITLNPDDLTHTVKTSRGDVSVGEIAKMVINQDRLRDLKDGDIATEARGLQNVFNLSHGGKDGFIEAGQMVEDGKGGHVLRVFATIRGTSPIPDTIETPGTETRALQHFDITAPSLFLSTEPEYVSSEAPPIIPIPISVRPPLEPVAKQNQPSATNQTDSSRPTTSETQEGNLVNLENSFQEVTGPVNPNNQYFINNPRAIVDELINIPEEEREPFVDSIPTALKPFPETTLEDHFGQDERYNSAKVAAKGGSGLFALAAASAQTPAEQADLYKILVNIVMLKHEYTPDLLNSWLRVQQQDIPGTTTAPIETFIDDDHINNIPNQPLKPLNERMLPYDENGRFDQRRFYNFWQQRLAELGSAADRNRLEPHHLKWIEFLSHSIDLPKLMEKIKQMPSATPTTEQLSVEEEEEEEERERFLRTMHIIENYFKLPTGPDWNVITVETAKLENSKIAYEPGSAQLIFSEIREFLHKNPNEKENLLTTLKSTFGAGKMFHNLDTIVNAFMAAYRLGIFFNKPEEKDYLYSVDEDGELSKEVLEKSKQAIAESNYNTAARFLQVADALIRDNHPDPTYNESFYEAVEAFSKLADQSIRPETATPPGPPPPRVRLQT